MSNGKRSPLGRGLGALIPGARDAAPAVPSPTEIAVALIDPNPEQPRRVFDPDQLQRLADSIQRHGVLQPVVVRRNGERFELLVGERRWRASQLAGRKTIPAVVADIASRDRLEIALIENVQRHDLNPIELALAFQALAEGGATQDEIGAKVGLDRSTIANHLRLLDLPRELQGDIEAGSLTMGHAKALLSVTNPERRHHLRDRILREGLSVRASEELARAATPVSTRTRSRSRPGQDEDPNVVALTDQLRDHLKTKVRLVGGPARGRIEIEYFSAAELDRLLDQLLGGMGR